MAVLSAHNLAKAYGAHDIFTNISLEVPHGAKIALVGANGVGKTTLLEVLIGLQEPTAGTVHRMKGLRIGYLPQRPPTSTERTLWEEALSAFDALRAQEARLAHLREAISAAEGAELERLLERYGHEEQQFADAGGYTYEARARQVLRGLGFGPEDDAKPLAHLSGGQRTRALLARLLLESPDLLVLDEPTNHLDIDAIEWLEGFLKSWPGALLTVSHDRYFMDSIVSTVWEMAWGRLEVYRGNYSHYVRQRAERHERLRKEYEAQQAFIAKEEAYIRRNIAGQNSAQAKGRLRRLERLKREKPLARPRQERHLRLQLRAELRSGDKVLHTRDLLIGYEAARPLLRVPEITLYRGEVAALIGPNGVGKTTLLKTLLGELPPLHGEVQLGAGVQIGYFAQAHEKLNPTNTVLDELLSVRNLPISKARSYLGAFLFRGDMVFREVSTLSGGERGRLALAKLALGGANFLLLDEPTNHLDIPSQEILQEVLAQFEGTILLVSHDRYLIDALATQIWAMQRGKMTVFEGSYQEFVRAREAQRQASARPQNAAPKPPTKTRATTQPTPKKPQLSPYQRQRRLEEVEARIQALDEQLAALTEQIGQASQQQAVERVRELGEQYAATEAALEAAMQEWETLLE